MFGLKIFMHAARMVLSNWQNALRIAVVPVAVGFGAATLAQSLLILPVQAGLVGPEPGGGSSAGMLVPALIWLLATMWIFVNWHRYILLEESPRGWVPPLPLGHIGAYIFKGIQMALLAALGFAPVMAVALAIGFGRLAMVLAVIWAGSAIYGFFRLSPVLPAAAVGAQLGFLEAWQATRPGAGAVVVVIFLVLALEQVTSFVGTQIFVLNPFLGMAALGVFWAVTSLISVSTLTTLYGHFVQGRALG